MVRQGSALIVSNSNGLYVDTNKYNKWIHKYCMAAGVTDHTSHDTRRYVISKLLREGIDANTVQHIAGHLCFSTTQSYERDIQYEKDTENVRRALG